MEKKNLQLPEPHVVPLRSIQTILHYSYLCLSYATVNVTVNVIATTCLRVFAKHR